MDAPAGEKDGSSGLVQLFRDLAPRLTAADDQDSAGWKRVGIAIALDIDLHEVGRKRRGARRPVRTLIRAGRKDDRP